MTEISILVGATIVVVDLAVVALIWQGLRLAALRAGWTRRAGTTLGWNFAIGLVAWVSFAVVFSAAFIADRPVTPLNGAAFVSLLLTVVTCACAFLLSPAWRQIVRAVPQHWIVAIQLYRVVGGVFLPVAAAGALPMWFAGPTAYGDFLAGFSAPLVAWLAYRQATGWRLAVLLWNLVGLADFVMAIGLGSQTLFVPWAQAMFGADAISTGLVRELPLVLIPQVVVPIGISLHLLSLWKLATEGQPVSSMESASAPPGRWRDDRNA